MQKVIVRAATTDDLPDLSRLWYQKIILQQQTDRRWKIDSNAQARWLAQVAHWFKDEHYQVLVGTKDDHPVGYIIGQLQAASPGLVPAHIGAVIDLVVEAHGQPEGVGRLLFEALGKWFQEQGIQEIVAHVPHRQVVDQAFWRALGATEWVDLMWLTL